MLKTLLVVAPAAIPLNALAQDLAHSVEELPIWTIGGIDGIGYELDRVNHVVMLSNGNVVVANYGSSELLLVDMSGKVLRVSGGEGEGPGEFSWVAHMVRLPGDTVMVSDISLDRVSFFDANLEFIRSFRLDPGVGIAQPTALGRIDGRYVIGQASVYSPGADGPQRIERDSSDVFFFDESSGDVELVLSYPGREFFIGQRQTPDGNSFFRMSRLLGHRSSVLVDGGAIMVLDNANPSVGRHGVDGRLLRAMQVTTDRVEVSSSVERLARQELLNGFRERFRPMVQDAINHNPAPDLLPAFDAVTPFVDRDSRVWISEFVLPGQETTSWSVLSRAGQLVARLELPVGARVMAAGGDRIVLRLTDELDVERLELRRVDGL